MRSVDLPDDVRQRRALIYVRQSTGAQVRDNLESQRRQYALADLARTYGFSDVVTIDDDLGRSASGLVARPGFEALVAQLCQGAVGAVFCLEASRLARNGRDWHHVLELCGLVCARVIDLDGIYDPSVPNDRLLLGLKGTMSEFELTLMRRRLVEGIQAKAQRGEYRIAVPIGYLWTRETELEMDPDRRVQEAIRTVWRLFDHRHDHVEHARLRDQHHQRPRHGRRYCTAGQRTADCKRRAPYAHQDDLARDHRCRRHRDAHTHVGQFQCGRSIVDVAVHGSNARRCSDDVRQYRHLYGCRRGTDADHPSQRLQHPRW